MTMLSHAIHITLYLILQFPGGMRTHPSQNSWHFRGPQANKSWGDTSCLLVFSPFQAEIWFPSADMMEILTVVAPLFHYISHKALMCGALQHRRVVLERESYEASSISPKHWTQHRHQHSNPSSQDTLFRNASSDQECCSQALLLIDTPQRSL